MSRLTWGAVEDRTYEAGISRGVLYPSDGPGVPWNGLVSVTEKFTGSERTALNYDGIKQADLFTYREFAATLRAFTYPEEFNPCLGNLEPIRGFYFTRQPRSSFALCYRTEVNERDYKLHLVYNASVLPHASRSNTLNASPSAEPLSWDIEAIPINVPGYNPTPRLIVDSRKTPEGMLDLLEGELYGRSGVDPYLPSREFLIEFLGNKITEPLTEPI